MNSQQPNVSVIDPITPAIERVKAMLFRPFELSKWFIIGFCAWLAMLGSGGGPNFNFNFGGHNFGDDPELHHAKEFVINHLPWFIIGGVFIFVLIIALGLLLSWLSSRGKFMFLHCVAENKAEVRAPWNKFRRHGNSLFLFRIVLGLIGFAVFILCVLVTVLLVILFAKAIGIKVLAIPVVILGILLFICIAIVFGLIGKFTTDFVVPIMFLRATSCVAAWREFFSLLSANKGRFALYILFQIVIAIAIGVIGASLACFFSCLLLCFTCGIAGCFMVLPPFSLGFAYVITVLLLPLTTFRRGYSLYYFGQFGPQYNVFAAPEETAPVSQD